MVFRSVVSLTWLLLGQGARLQDDGALKFIGASRDALADQAQLQKS
jgi:hypothetical protein